MQRWKVLWTEYLRLPPPPPANLYVESLTMEGDGVRRQGR